MPTTPPLAFIAFDLGAESGRATLGILQNQQLTLHEAHRFTHLPRTYPTGLHWNLTDIYANLLTGLRAANKLADELNVTPTSIGVDTWGVDFALIDPSGELLGLPHCYRDPAHQPAYETVTQQLTKNFLYQQTGIQFMWLNTLYQLAARHQNSPALFQQAKHLLFMPDLFHFLFTGIPTVEATIASTSQFTNPQTAHTTYATAVLEKLNIPTHFLTPIIQPGTTIGPILPQLAADTNSPTNLKVVAPASHDTAAAVAAVPAQAGPDSDWAFLSSGTWSLMGAELSKPNLSPAAQAIPFTNEGGVDNTIRFLKNIAGLWLVQECRRHFQKQSHDSQNLDYTTLTHLASQAEPFRTLIDTTHKPFALPGNMPDKIADFAQATNQPVPQTPGQFIRTCLESLALTYRQTLEQLQQTLNRKFNTLHIVGGGTKNQLLNQMTADALNLIVTAGPEEATAAGNILTQALATPHVNSLADIRQISQHSFSPTTYKPQNPQPYNAAYQRFTKLLHN